MLYYRLQRSFWFAAVRCTLKTLILGFGEQCSLAVAEAIPRAVQEILAMLAEEAD